MFDSKETHLFLKISVYVIKALIYHYERGRSQCLKDSLKSLICLLRKDLFELFEFSRQKCTCTVHKEVAKFLGKVKMRLFVQFSTTV